MIFFGGEAQADLDRIFEFNFERDPAKALQHVEWIMEAVLILDGHPEIGRAITGSSLRGLVISQGKSGYVALYEYSPVENIVRVAAVRHQREAGYRGS